MPMLEFTTHFTRLEINTAAFEGLPLEDILQGDITRGNSDVFVPHNNTRVACVTSILDTRLRCSSRPSLIRVPSFVSTSPPISTWFDDSPTRSVFTILDDDTSTSSWGNKNQWLDEDIAHPTFPDRECDRTSTISFSPLSDTTSSLALESHDSHTLVPTEDDRESMTSGFKYHILDCLDDQLLHSPMDSFAAMCWDAAVTPEKPRSKDNNNKAAELRFSKLFSDTAWQYEEAHIRESSHLAMMTLPRMKFDEPKTAPIEVPYTFTLPLAILVTSWYLTGCSLVIYLEESHIIVGPTTGLVSCS